MGIKQFLARHPGRLDTLHPLFIEDLLKLAEEHKQEAVSACLEMCSDLYHNGSSSQYIHPVQGQVLFALKRHTKNQATATVYFYWRMPGEAVLLHAEATPQDHIDPDLLNACAEVWMADRQGFSVLDRGPRGQ